MGKRKAAEEEEVENEKPSWDRVEMERGGQPAEKRLRGSTRAGTRGECLQPQKRAARASKTKAIKEEVVSSNPELLEEMGVGPLVSDSPCTSTAPPKPAVLQVKNPNVVVDRGAVTDSGGGSSSLRGAGVGGEVLWNPSLNCSYLAPNYDGNASYLLPSETPGSAQASPHDYSLPLDLKPEDMQRYRRRVSLPRKAPAGGRDLFNLMSEEVVLSVFRWLPKSTLARCARVCKRWERLTGDDTLWKRLDLGLAAVPAGVLGTVLSRGCSILRLARATMAENIFTSPISNQVTFPLGGAGPDSSKLSHLDLSMATISSTCLASLLSSCRLLQKLALENCRLNEAAVNAIAQNSGLQVLHLGGTYGLTGPLVTHLLASCPMIQELNIGWTGLTMAGVEAVVTGVSPNIERLCFSGNRDALLDSHLSTLGDRCHNLKELDVSDSTKLTALTIATVVEKMPVLEALSTSRCYGIVPNSYLALCDCPSLLYLNLFGVLRELAMEELVLRLKDIEINKFMFTSVARPTVGIKRTSIWNLRVRD